MPTNPRQRREERREDAYSKDRGEKRSGERGEKMPPTEDKERG
jgi:hypothetical protein